MAQDACSTMVVQMAVRLQRTDTPLDCTGCVFADVSCLHMIGDGKLKPCYMQIYVADGRPEVVPNA